MHHHQPEDPHLDSFEHPPQGEDPDVDLRHSVADRLSRLVAIGQRDLGHPWSTKIKIRGTNELVKLDDIELQPGDERNTLHARVRETVGEHKVWVSIGAITVATGLITLAAAHVRSHKKDKK